MSPQSRTRVLTALVPPIAIAILLYQLLTDLQIAINQPEVIMLVGALLAVGALLGLAAAFGGTTVRALVLAVTTVTVLDVTMPLPVSIDWLDPAARAARARDAERVRDVHFLKEQLDVWIARTGGLPSPEDYGEGTGPLGFWQGWWDVSSHDGDADGLPFLDFLVAGGQLTSVPVDPENTPPPDGRPTGGRQYALLVLEPGYVYEGGVCTAGEDGAFLLAVTDLETETGRPPRSFPGSGCDCLWRDRPDFFADQFDYTVCGTIPSVWTARGHAP